MSTRGANVVVVDPYSSGEMLAPALRAHGLTPVAVTTTPKPPEIYLHTFHPDDFDMVLPHTGSLAELLGRLRALCPLAVVPGAETGVELADLLAEALTPDRANEPASRAARRHKGAMADAVRSAGLPTLRTFAGRDVTEVRAWLSRTGLADQDLVIKPASSGGSDNIRLVPAGADWSGVFHEVLDAPNILGGTNGEVVVQEFARGTEYVVDTISVAGVHSISSVIRYHKVAGPAHMAVYESMEFVAEQADVVGYVRGVLDAVGLRYGAAHTEVMLTEDGPRLIEVNARLAGGGLPDTCELATGVNPVQQLVDDLVDPIVDPVAGPRGYTLVMPVVVLFFVIESEGYLYNTAAYQQISRLPSCRFLSVRVRDGDHVAPSSHLHVSLGHGLVVLGNTDRAVLAADRAEVRRIERQVVIESAPR